MPLPTDFLFEMALEEMAIRDKMIEDKVQQNTEKNVAEMLLPMVENEDPKPEIDDIDYLK